MSKQTRTKISFSYSPSMIRDLTMILSVLVAVVSVGFGVYKNIEANNAKGFAYQQAYKIIDAVQQANISGSAKESVTDAALSTFSTPPPVVDLTRSHADNSTPSACSAQQQTACASMASDLATANALCSRNQPESPAACANAGTLKAQISSANCFVCFSQ